MTKDDLIYTLTEFNHDDARYSITELFEKIENAVCEYEIDTGDKQTRIFVSDYIRANDVCRHLKEKFSYTDNDWSDNIIEVKKCLSEVKPEPPIYRLDDDNVLRNITRKDIKELQDKILTYLRSTDCGNAKKELLIKLNTIYNHLESRFETQFDASDRIFENIVELCHTYAERTQDFSLTGCFSNVYNSNGIREVIISELNPVHNRATDSLYNILDMLSEYNGEDYTYHILDEDNTFHPIEKEDLEELITDIRKKLGEE